MSRRHFDVPPGWADEQRRLAKLALIDDSGLDFYLPWDDAAVKATRRSGPLKYVGGMDISFVKDSNHAVASIVVLSYPEMKVLHTVLHHCDLDVPYIPGFLAFREVQPLREAYEQLLREQPALKPQIIFMDGNGVLHPHRCGVATHFGVVCDIPTVGCAKELLAVDGLERDDIRRRVTALTAGTDARAAPPLLPLQGKSGTQWGYAVLTGNSETKPIYISAGHRISQLTAAKLSLSMAPFRVVEPIRQADHLSRQFIRMTFP